VLSKVLFVGPTEPFRSEFANEVMEKYERIIRALSMIIVTSEEWEENTSTLTEGSAGTAGVLETLKGLKGMSDLQYQLMTAFERVHHVVPEMLDSTPKEGWENDVSRPDQVARELVGTDDLLLALLRHKVTLSEKACKDLTEDLQIRMLVTLGSFDQTAFHLARIEERVIKHLSWGIMSSHP